MDSNRGMGMKYDKLKGKAFINFNKTAQRFEVIKDKQLIATYSNYVQAMERQQMENGE